MTTIEYLNGLTEYAKDYSIIAKQSVIRNNHMNDINSGEFIEQKHIDAILVDFINYIASLQGVDYGLYTDDINATAH